MSFACLFGIILSYSRLRGKSGNISEISHFLVFYPFPNAHHNKYYIVGCNTTHGDISEISVSSFSWRNKKNPAFLLGYFSQEGHSLTKCYMPDENTVFTTYCFFISFAIFSLFIK